MCVLKQRESLLQGDTSHELFNKILSGYIIIFIRVCTIEKDVAENWATLMLTPVYHYTFRNVLTNAMYTKKHSHKNIYI